MLDEETLAGGQGSVLPAHKQTGILSYSSFAYTISTHGGLSTRMHKQYMRRFALSLSFISQNCCCISLYLYSTFLPSSSLYIHHSRLTSRITAEALYLKLPISISSFRHAAALASPRGKLVLRSTLPAPCTDAGTSAAVQSHPLPSKQQDCFPALDYFWFTQILPSQHQLAKIHLEFKSKCTPRLHNPAAAAAAVPDTPNYRLSPKRRHAALEH